MREMTKFKVSSQDIYLDIVNRLNDEKVNVITIHSLADILKNRVKRGDAESLHMYKKYIINKLERSKRYEKLKLTDKVINATLDTAFKKYLETTDIKERDKLTDFEDIEQQYFYTYIKEE